MPEPVQLSETKRPGPGGLLEKFQPHFIGLMAASFSDWRPPQLRGACRTLFAHVVRATDRRPLGGGAGATTGETCVQRGTVRTAAGQA